MESVPHVPAVPISNGTPSRARACISKRLIHDLGGSLQLFGLLGVLPEASTLAAHLVINALLAECASRLRLSPADLRKHHPGGAIGRRLADCMPRRDSL